MGQRQNKTDIEYGDDCVHCFDPGKTPKYLYARFSLVEKCDPHRPPVCKVPPNDRVFKLTQHHIDPCIFTYQSADWSVEFYFAFIPVPVTFLHLRDGLGWDYFYGDAPGCIAEGHVFTNAITCDWVTGCSSGGTAVVTWGLEALKVMELINIETAKDLFMEMRPLDDGARVFKFCKLKDATNIAIKFNPD